MKLPGRKGKKRRKRPQPQREEISIELDALFGPSKKHVHERKEWVAVAKVDDHESGAGGGPIDLDSGVVRLNLTNPGQG